LEHVKRFKLCNSFATDAGPSFKVRDTFYKIGQIGLNQLWLRSAGWQPPSWPVV